MQDRPGKRFPTWVTLSAPFGGLLLLIVWLRGRFIPLSQQIRHYSDVSSWTVEKAGEPLIPRKVLIFSSPYRSWKFRSPAEPPSPGIYQSCLGSALPFECEYTQDTSFLNSSDAAFYHLFSWKSEFNQVPIYPKPKLSILHCLEGAHRVPRVLNTDGEFTATSSYRLDSDIPMPYMVSHGFYHHATTCADWGQHYPSTRNATLTKREQTVTNVFAKKQSDKVKFPHVLDIFGVAPVDFESAISGASFISTNCNSKKVKNRRLDLFVELSKYIQIDSMGKCLRNKAWPTNIPGKRRSLFDTSHEASSFMSVAEENKTLTRSLYSADKAASGQTLRLGREGDSGMNGAEGLPTASGWLASKIAVMGQYKLHLAFENGNSDDYVTEKLYSALAAGTIPVYLGARNVELLVPDKTCIINVNDFQSTEELGRYLQKVVSNKTTFDFHQEWRKRGLHTIEDGSSGSGEPDEGAQDDAQMRCPKNQEWLSQFSALSETVGCRVCKYVYAAKYGFHWDKVKQTFIHP
eukprot:GHVS01084226.1.p1 GENE.GHVS01084226.1~~GHVS01084226.1.p1  ORF type:complete len:519 (+),score=16.00 GHVS01084226.1:174-1730(+)